MLSKDFKWLVQEVKKIMREMGNDNKEITYIKMYDGYDTNFYPSVIIVEESDLLEFYDMYNAEKDEEYYICVPISKKLLDSIFEEERKKIERIEMEEYERLRKKFEKKGDNK